MLENLGRIRGVQVVAFPRGAIPDIDPFVNAAVACRRYPERVGSRSSAIASSTRILNASL
jgi:hypothetical protein